MPSGKSFFNILSALFLAHSMAFAQNETSQWYFGGYAGFDHMSSPPAIITNTNLSTGEGMASISDASGNLLFYTDGVKIWNQQQNIMANGTGLLGNYSSTQSALIAKQPGNNNIYYVFTTPDLYYSIVDMNLAAGMGSVTTKNVLLASAVSEKLAGTKHCNGNDVWILTREITGANFFAFQVTATGVNTTAVTSTFTSAYNYFQRYMKFSPNGNKVGMAGLLLPSSPLFASIEIFDFDNSTGVVSNSLSIASGTHISGGGYGCEFSSDGTKFYLGVPSGSGKLFQWDLCAGSNSAIVASVYSLTTSPSNPWAMQLAPSGKIYCAAGQGSQPLAVINNPNNAGAACNFSAAAQPIGAANCNLGLPNFVSSYFRLPINNPPFVSSVTASISCNIVAFSLGTSSYPNCNASNYSFSTLLWDFGDPGSGAANTSTLTNPVHTYPGAGSYSVSLLLYLKCRTDTLRQTIIIGGPTPTLNLLGNFTVCAGNSTTITVNGANTYSWSNNVTVSFAAFSPTITTSYSVIGTNTISGCSQNKTFTVVVSKCANIQNNLSSEGLDVFPNPAADVLYIRGGSTVHLFVVDCLGNIVIERDIIRATQEIDIGDLTSGIYVVQLKSAAGVRTIKLIKL